MNTNVDSTEIAKFERLAERWWDKNGEFKPLHDLNPLRANYIDERSPVAGKKLLDVGCGGGILCEAMSARGATVHGIDMGDAPLEIARLHSLESGHKIHYEKNTAEDFAEIHPAEFDIVCCLEMLEHVPDPAKIVSACQKLVKPGGAVYFSTINRNPKAWLFAIVGAEYVLKLLPKGTHDYRKLIKPSELAKWIRAAHLDLRDLSGMTYNPVSKLYKMDPHDVKINYIVHALNATFENENKT